LAEAVGQITVIANEYIIWETQLKPTIDRAWQLQSSAGPFGVNAASETNERLRFPMVIVNRLALSPKNLHNERHHLSC
jgi:hypothetical protein